MAIFRVVSVNSGKVLDVEGAHQGDNGANVQQWDWWGGRNQQWSFETLGTITGKEVVWMICEASDKLLSLDLTWLFLVNGVNVQQWECWGGGNQLWYRLRLGDGSYQFQSVLSGKVLDVADLSKDNGGNVQVWDNWNGPNQIWRLEQVG